eukprot:9019746-Ditylum_brightwellii.AAC.1
MAGLTTYQRVLDEGGKACEVGEGGGEVASAGEGLKPPPKSPVESTERALPGEEGVGQNAMA